MSYRDMTNASRERAREMAADQAARAEHREDLATDKYENELHAGAGQECPLCHQAIAAGQPVRLRADGMYQHESCPAG
jgi:hypothetical protein